MYKKTLLLALSSALALSSCTKGTVEVLHDQKIAAFDQQSVNQTLIDLIQVDIDSYHVYSQAAKKVKDNDVRNLLLNLAASHEQHINVLSRVVLNRGSYPPGFSRDFKGFVTSGYTSLKVSGGHLQTLDAIKTSEAISHRYYEGALSLSMPERIRDILRKHLEDEKLHLNAVQNLQDLLRNK